MIEPRPAGRPAPRPRTGHPDVRRAPAPRRPVAAEHRPGTTTGRRAPAARPARAGRTVPVALAALAVLLAMGTVLALFSGHRSAGPTTTALSASAPAPAAAATAPATPPGPAVVTPAELARCPATSTACVDLVARKAWLQRDGHPTVGPVPMLPGADTFLRPPGPTSSATPTGSFHVLWKDADAFSSEFDEPMHHAVYFAAGGIAFHEGSLTTSSNGCIHLTAADAATFFEHLRPGDGVTVF